MLWFRCGRARREKPVMGSLGGQLTKQKCSAAGKARSICNVVFQSLSCVRLGRLPCPSLSPGVCSNLCSLSRWCHPTISSSVVPFSFCPRSFLGSGSFPMSWFLTSDGQSLLAILTPFWFSSQIYTFCSRSFWQKRWWSTACLLGISNDLFGAGKTSSQKIMSYEGGKDMVMQEICF